MTASWVIVEYIRNKTNDETTTDLALEIYKLPNTRSVSDPDYHFNPSYLK